MHRHTMPKNRSRELADDTGTLSDRQLVILGDGLKHRHEVAPWNLAGTVRPEAAGRRLIAIPNGAILGISGGPPSPRCDHCPNQSLDQPSFSPLLLTQVAIESRAWSRGTPSPSSAASCIAMRRRRAFRRFLRRTRALAMGRALATRHAAVASGAPCRRKRVGPGAVNSYSVLTSDSATPSTPQAKRVQVTQMHAS